MIKKTVSPIKQAQRKMLKQVNKLHAKQLQKVKKGLDEMVRCEFCDENEPIKVDNECLYVDKRNKTLTHKFEDWDGSYSETSFPIDYCPKCGRKLE